MVLREEMSTPQSARNTPIAAVRERITLRMAGYVLLICGVGITLAHLAVRAAMREEMYDHQRVLSALTPMLPDDRQGIAADTGPIEVPGADAAIDLRGVSKGALVSTDKTDRAYCRGLRPSILWSDGQRAYQLAAMRGANHDWDAASVLLGSEIAQWLQLHCQDAARAEGVEQLVAMTPFDIPAAAYADYEQGMLLIVTSLPGRRAAFDELLASPRGANPLENMVQVRAFSAVNQ